MGPHTSVNRFIGSRCATRCLSTGVPKITSPTDGTQRCDTPLDSGTRSDTGFLDEDTSSVAEKLEFGNMISL